MNKMHHLKENYTINKRYVIRRCLGKGSHAIVYLASDKYISNQDIAVKMMLKRFMNRKGSVERFKNEFDIMTRLKHPNLTDVYSFGRDEKLDRYYMTMEYINGITLRKIIDEKRLESLKDKIDIFVEILRGTEFIHSRNIIYRDLKPSNIIISGKKVKLMDFGLSDINRIDKSNVKGSIMYFAPEIFLQKGDHRIDIFALGIIFIELLTGESLYRDNSVSTMISLFIDEETFVENQKRVIDSYIPCSLRKILHKMTAFSSRKRYISCMDIIEDINSSLGMSYPLETDNTREAYVSGVRFTDRKKELKKIKEIIISDDHPPMFVLVSGNMGIGKSTLFLEIKKFCQLNDMLFFRSDCTREASGPLYAINQIMQQLDYYSSKPFSAIRKEQYPGLVRADFGHTLRHDEMSHYLQHIINHIISFISHSKQKAVFYINDISLIDNASLDIISRIMLILSDRPALGKKIRISASIRDDMADSFIKRADCCRLSDFITITRLRPFGKMHVKEYIENVFGQYHLDKSIKMNIPHITRRVGGNPSFLHEFISYGLKRGMIARRGSHWEFNADINALEVPETINEILDSKILFYMDNPASRRLLLVFSLLRIPLSINHLYSFFHDMDRQYLSDIVIKLERAGIIIQGSINRPYCMIANDIIREKILKNTAINKSIHEFIAQRLEHAFQSDTDEIAQELAYHYRFTDNKKKEIYYIQRYCLSMVLKYYDFDRLISYYSRAISLSLKIYGKNSRATAELYESIADIYRKNSDYTRACDFYKLALSVSEKLDETPGTLSSNILKKLGSVYYRNHDLDKAMELYEKSLKIQQGSIKDEDINSADLYVKIAEICISKDSFENALIYLNKAYAIFNEKCGDDIFQIIDILEAFAFYYFQKGENKRSSEFIYKIIEIKEQFEKPTSIGFAVEFMRLGIIYTRLGLFKEALKYLKKSSRIQRSYYKVEHPDIASVYSSIGVVYLKLSNYRNAMKYMKKALRIYECFYGENSTWTADAKINLCNIYSDQGRYIPALRLALKALSIYASIYGPNSTQSALAYNNIGIQYNKSNNPEKAIYYLKRALRINKSVYTDSNPVLGINYINIGVSYHQMKKYNTAVQYYKKAHENFLKTLGPGHPNCSHTLYNIGLCCQFQKKLKKALSYFEKALEISVPSLGTDNPYSRSQYQSIIEILREKGDDEGISRYRKLFSSWKEKNG